MFPSMSAEDRNALVILKRWAQNPEFLRADVTICLIAENQIELNQGIVQNPGVASIQIPLPDETERLRFIRAQLAAAPLPAGSDVTDSRARQTGRRPEARATADPHLTRRAEPAAAHHQIPYRTQERADRSRIGRPARIHSDPIRSVHGRGARAGQEEITECRRGHSRPATPKCCPWAT